MPAASAWPEDLRRVFAAVGELMGGGRLRPELLKSLSPEPGAIIPGHRVSITHQSRAVLKDRSGVYVIIIEGDRWTDGGGAWRFRQGELEQLARSAGKLPA
jgi:hypothetical protein